MIGKWLLHRMDGCLGPSDHDHCISDGRSVSPLSASDRVSAQIVVMDVVLCLNLSGYCLP